MLPTNIQPTQQKVKVYLPYVVSIYGKYQANIGPYMTLAIAQEHLLRYINNTANLEFVAREPRWVKVSKRRWQLRVKLARKLKRRREPLLAEIIEITVPQTTIAERRPHG